MDPPVRIAASHQDWTAENCTGNIRLDPDIPMHRVERDIQRIRSRLMREGWTVIPSSGPHEKFRHPDRSEMVIVPRGRGDLPTGTARSIARAARWT